MATHTDTSTPMPLRPFQDHFSAVAPIYRTARPSYPPELFLWLASLPHERNLAWDAACGSGQVATGLAQHFSQVLATDASAQQISQAPQHHNITYRIERAESTAIADASVDLVTVGEALHWLDLPAFLTEVRRVLRPGGYFAAFCYNLPVADDPAISEHLRKLDNELLSPYWTPEHQLVVERYQSIDLPIATCSTPAFVMQEQWQLPQLLSFLRSMSGTLQLIALEGAARLEAWERELEKLWGGKERTAALFWDLGVLAGRNERSMAC